MYKLYSSGIMVGKIDTVFYMLNPYSQLFDKADHDDFKKKYHLDIKKIIDSWNDYQVYIDNASDTFITSDDKKYEKNNEFWVERDTSNCLDIITYENQVIGFTTSGRSTNTLLVKEGYEHLTPLSVYSELDDDLSAVEDAGTFMVKMRDGISLSTKILLPKGKKPVPVILYRTPYGKSSYVNQLIPFVQRGYGVVIQDTRGRDDSEGEWSPCYYEADDGDDTLTWIGESDFCDGNIGMFGGSYSGYVQWAAASSGNPYLKAIVSQVTAGTPFVDLPYKGGCLISGALAWVFAMSEKTIKPELMQQDWDSILNIRPISDIINNGLNKDVPYWKEWCDNDHENGFWKHQNWYDKKHQMNDIPSLILSGWYDDDNMGTTQAIDIVNECGFSNYKIILGPWLHRCNSTRDINGVPLGKDAIRYDLDFQYLNWFEQHLKGKSKDKNCTEYYDVGLKKWRTSLKWPPSPNKTSLYFDEAFDCKGDYSSYIYDPKNLAPHIIDISSNEASPPGDYQEIIKRSDVLYLETDVLETEVSVAGDVVFDFFASSDCKDTDWVVRVLDVHPDGQAIKTSENVLRAKFRNGFESPELMEEGEVYNFKIRTSKVANTFKVGHRIGVMITSSAEGYIFPNTNTGENPCYDTGSRIANQKIYHNDKYRSRIILPIN